MQCRIDLDTVHFSLYCYEIAAPQKLVMTGPQQAIILIGSLYCTACRPSVCSLVLDSHLFVNCHVLSFDLSLYSLSLFLPCDLFITIFIIPCSCILDDLIGKCLRVSFAHIIDLNPT